MIYHYIYKTDCVSNGYRIDEIYTDLQITFDIRIDHRILIISKLKTTRIYEAYEPMLSWFVPLDALNFPKR